MNRPMIDLAKPDVVSRIMHKIVTNTPVGYLIHDRNLRVHYVNDYYLNLRKLRREDVLGNHCYNVNNKGVPCPVCAVRDALKTDARCCVRRKDTLPDATVRYVDDYAVPLHSHSGECEFILEVMVNRTNEMHLRKNNAAMFVNIIEALAAMLDKKDAYTSTHSRDVTEISVKLAAHIGFRDEEKYELRLASLLHDIGKIHTPDHIIGKTSPLTEEEYLIIRRHPADTLTILENLSKFANIRDMAGHHHERWDGKGYPERLRGEAIPLGARIIALADTYDAMTSTRSYRRALPHHIALREIAKNSGSQFDPVLTPKFLELATKLFPSRASLIARDTQKGEVFASREGTRRVKRRFSSIRRTADKTVNDKGVAELLSGEQCIDAIFDNTPAYFTLVDDEFRILFASPNLARDTGHSLGTLTTMRCFELNGRKTACFKVEEGKIRFPLIRAFETGTPEQGMMVEKFRGRDFYSDLTAIPMEIEDAAGAPLKCMLMITIDRTAEFIERVELHSDVKHLLDMLFKLVANIDTTAVRRSGDIIDECETFGDYLQLMLRRMRHLTGTRRRRKETAEL